MADIKDLVLSPGETVYALNCFKRIYEIDKADPTRSLELEEYNKGLQETFAILSHVGGYRFSYESSVDTTPTYSPPTPRKYQPSHPLPSPSKREGDIENE